MTLEGIDHVHYWTRDMDRAVEFYRDTLGLVMLRRDGQNWCEFDGISIRFALHGVSQSSSSTTQRSAPGGATVVFRVDDLDAERGRLEAAGVMFHEQVGEVPGYARFASFDDPDGNTVQIIQYVAPQ
jgi:catechol 2,3-dioxygenase-like lactoylglutathione lyase family enzyme